MRTPRRTLLLGAGGMGMFPLALYLRGAGVRVEAYDDTLGEPMRSKLESVGAHVLDEPCPIKKPDCIVRSSAVPPDGDMIRGLSALGVPIYRRGDFVAELISRKRLIAVVGSHGKSSVTGKLIWALKQIGFPFSYMVGASFRSAAEPSGSFVKSPWVVMEIDESDGTIEGFRPWITLALNCDWDHVDRYEDHDGLVRAFSDLFSRTSKRVILEKSLSVKGSLCLKKYCEVSFFRGTKTPADFNEANHRAVEAVGEAMGLSFDEVDFSLFPGMERRQEVLFEDESRAIVEDYAHHPTEIAAFLEMRRKVFPERAMKVVFQPHRFSRTRALAPAFAEELSRADELMLMPTYGAFEPYEAGGAVENLLGSLPPRLRESTGVFEDFHSLSQAIGMRSQAGAPDQVLFVGAGNLTKWAHAFASLHCADGTEADAFGHYARPRLSESTVFLENHPIGSMTTMGVGGSAKWYAEPVNKEELKTLVDACQLFGLPRSMIGRGSNLIVPDHGYRGLIIRLRGAFWDSIEPRTEDTLIVGSGAKLNDICKFACKRGMVGFEFLEGIPGTLGGALRMNAGAMGWEIFDLVEWVSFLMPDGRIMEIPGCELEVGYRFCREAYDGIALRAKLRAQGLGTHTEIRKVIDEMFRKRSKSQPRQASSGCVFRNPPEVSAGWLIDQAGLKGEHVGGAVVSDLHGNFILNKGGAKASEVIQLIRRVRERVKDSHGLLLEPEVNLLGESWNRYLS